MSNNDPIEPTTAEPEAPPAPKPPVSKALVAILIVGYALFVAYTGARNLWASCDAQSGTLRREWTYADSLLCLLLGGIFMAVVRNAINGSDLPEEVKAKIDAVLTQVTELKEAEAATLQEIRERRASQWQSPFPEPQAAVTAAVPPEPEPEGDGALTTREFVLSTGHHVKARVRRET